MKISIDKTVNIITEKLYTWYKTASEMLPNIVVAIFCILFFYILAIFIEKLACRLAKRMTRSRSLVELFSKACFLIFFFIGIFIALGVLDLQKTITSMLAGAGIIGLALGFAFQEIASNFVSGVLISINNPYDVGDIVEIDGVKGEVKRINLRTTDIRQFDGLDVLVPNKDMFTKTFTNLTHTPFRRVDLELGVSYEDDLDKVEKVTYQVLKNNELRIESKKPEVLFYEFGGSSINLQARIWVRYPGENDYLKAKHQLVKEIKKAYDENDINIPFPIRTIIQKKES